MRPNILLITDDQHRFDFFGRTGAVPALRTPNWDRLVEEGALFERAYSNCPICMPTRFTWLYGLYASQAPAGLLGNAHDWPTAYTSIAHLLQEADYSTALIGKLHSKAGVFFHNIVKDEAETRARGFDYVDEVSGKALAYWFDCRWTEHLEEIGKLDYYRSRFTDMQAVFEYGEPVPIDLDPKDTMDGYIGGKAREYLQSVSTDKPFFAHVSFCGPHFPIDPPEKYWGMYRDAEVPPPEGVEDVEKIEEWQDRRRRYCALIHQLDDEIGSLLSMLEERGLAENTLVIYACDHGDMMGWNDQKHKSRPYEFSARTPMIARWPGRIAAGQVFDDPIEAVDLPATIIDAAGVASDIREKIPESPGRSFLPLGTGKGAAAREWAYSEWGMGEKAWRMVYADGWKYIERGNGECELYDVIADPLEAQNRVSDPGQAGRVSTMRSQLVRSMMQCVAPSTVPVPPGITDPEKIHAPRKGV
ncbi:MAG: sulfatase [Candidatus Sumerlaeota bacterium]